MGVGPTGPALVVPCEHRLIVRETALTGGQADATAGIQTLYAALAADEARTRQILDDVIRALEEGRSPILLTEREGRRPN
jgi:hypothetical protein